MTWKFVTMCSWEAQVCQSSNGPHAKLRYTIDDVLRFWSNKSLRTYQKISISINISQSTAPKIVQPPLLVPKEATTSALRNLLQIHRKAPGASDQGFLVGLGCWQGADLFTTACVLFEEVNTIYIYIYIYIHIIIIIVMNLVELCVWSWHPVWPRQKQLHPSPWSFDMS